MNGFSLSFDPAQLNRLFPYFILLDSDMTILDIGSKLQDVCKDCQNKNLYSYFELQEFNDNGQPALGKTSYIKLKNGHGKISGSWEKYSNNTLLFFTGLNYVPNGLSEANENNNTTADTQPLHNIADFDGILSNIGFGFIEMDAEGKIRYANNRFCDMSGYDLPSIRNQMPDLLFNNDFFSKDAIIQESEEKNAELHEIVFTDAQGNQRLWMASRTVSYNENNQNTGWSSICFDVSNCKRFGQELIIAKNEAEKTANIKAMFLANMSHEIRTPMNAIISMANQLSKTTLTDEQDYYVQTVQTASKNLLVIIDDILDLSKIDEGKLKFEHIGFSLPMLFNEVIQVVTHKAVNRGLELNYLPPKEGTVSSILMGDPYRITQVLMNLMTNAIKFTENGSVDLTATVLEDALNYQEIEILVKDTGIGMEPEFLSRLFDNFSQEYESVTRKYGGTGLGMSISQKLVAQMGGYFKVKSQKGQGSEISFVIKLEKGKTNDVPAQNKIVHNEDLFAGRRILIVDDNEMNRLVASTVLLGYGPQVMIADDGAIALEMLEEEIYDVILMDIQMPVLDGYDTTKALRARGYTGIIIALTASAIKGEREKCLAAGMNDYITKPINEELLISVLDSWIQKTAAPIIAPATPLPLYSLDGLRVISKGREDFVTKMIEMFCGQMPDTLNQLNQAHNEGDLEQVSKLAHKLKSTIDHLAILPLQRTIREIEAANEANVSAPKLAEMIAEVNDILNQVMAELKEEIAVRNQ